MFGLRRGPTLRGTGWKCTRHKDCGVPLRGNPPYGLEAFAFDALALHFAGAADGFRRFTGATLGGFFVMPAEFHFAEHAFALELLFQRFQRLIDVIIANENLHLAENSCGAPILKAENVKRRTRPERP